MISAATDSTDGVTIVGSSRQGQGEEVHVEQEHDLGAL